MIEKACALGWAKEQVIIIDKDLGLSGSGSANRSGFARMTADVALGHVGIVLGLEVSRLGRNNADWCRLLDLWGMTDTLIGDSDGVYHPLFYDRLVLGLKRLSPVPTRSSLYETQTWKSSEFLFTLPPTFLSFPISNCKSVLVRS